MLYRVTVDVTYSTDLYVFADSPEEANKRVTESVKSNDADMRTAHLLDVSIYETEEAEE